MGRNRKRYLHSNMFLLIHKGDWQLDYSYAHLHSNMFLLIQRQQGVTALLLYHLHSNMFLLIPLPYSLSLCHVANLHSNMFLLIQKSHCGRYALKQRFTFQYVSINTRFSYMLIFQYLTISFLST